jgi:DNA invertase Pin-like site-specific DNA recombinase
LQEALDFLQEGDSLVVWRLDRLGRSLRHLIDTVSELEERGIGVRSIQESIDTNTSGGRLILHIFGALAEFERNLIRERTMAGLRAAWARGRVGGRPRKLDAKMTELAYQLYAGKKYAVNEICQILEISKPTLYAYLQRRNENSEKRPQKTFAGD